MNAPKVEPCRSCKAPVVWAKTVNDKWAPFDAKPERRFVLHAGEDNILRAEAQPTYQSHYATCPDAKAWRAGAAGKPPNDQQRPVHYPGHNPAIPAQPPNDQPPPEAPPSETPFTDGLRTQLGRERKDLD